MRQQLGSDFSLDDAVILTWYSLLLEPKDPADWRPRARSSHRLRSYSLASVSEGQPPPMGGNVAPCWAVEQGVHGMCGTAARLGAQSVTVLYRRSRRETRVSWPKRRPPKPRVRLETLVAPLRLEGDDGGASG